MPFRIWTSTPIVSPSFGLTVLSTPWPNAVIGLWPRAAPAEEYAATRSKAMRALRGVMKPGMVISR